MRRFGGGPGYTYLVTKDGVYPKTFQHDSMAIYHEAISIEGGELRVNATRPAELVEFASLWMRNMEEQPFE